MGAVVPMRVVEVEAVLLEQVEVAAPWVRPSSGMFSGRLGVLGVFSTFYSARCDWWDSLLEALALGLESRIVISVVSLPLLRAQSVAAAQCPVTLYVAILYDLLMPHTYNCILTSFSLHDDLSLASTVRVQGKAKGQPYLE